MARSECQLAGGAARTPSPGAGGRIEAGPAAAPSLTIVHVCPYYWPSVGGAETQMQALSEHLAARGHRVTVVTQRRVSPTHPDGAGHGLPARDTINGVSVVRLPARPWLESLVARGARLPGIWRALVRLLGEARLRGLVGGPLVPETFWLARRVRADVIAFSNYYYAGMVYPFLRPRAKRRYRVVGMPLLHIEQAWSHEPVTADLLMRSDALCVNTAYERGYIAALGVPSDRIEVCGAGVEPAAFADRDGARMRAVHGLGDAPVVGYIGRLSVEKGVLTLLGAMRLVWRSTPSARLVLAGQRYPVGSAMDRPIQAALDDLTPAERAQVVLVEDFPDADKASLYDALDVFAMPSIAESFGIAYAEAWMCGKPVIGGRIGAVECVIDDGADGLLVPPEDPRATAEAIAALLSDPDRRRRMGEAGRAKTESRFTWERIADITERLYRRIAAAPPALGS